MTIGRIERISSIEPIQRITRIERVKRINNRIKSEDVKRVAVIRDERLGKYVDIIIDGPIFRDDFKLYY